MYETLTKYIPLLQSESFGEWIIDTENDGTMEHPYRAPFVAYSDAVYGLIDDVHAFVDEHPDLGLTRYHQILEASGLSWGMKPMSEADVSSYDSKTVLAMLVGAVRAERFCDGALLGFCSNGSIVRWLQRLQELERE